MINFYFLKNFHQKNELSNYYTLKKDYEIIFENLDDDIKNYLNILTDIFYNNITKKLETFKQFVIDLDGVNYIDEFECYIQVYLNLESKGPEIFSPKIGLLVDLLSDEYIGNYYDTVQNISYENFWVPK